MLSFKIMEGFFDKIIVDSKGAFATGGVHVAVRGSDHVLPGLPPQGRKEVEVRSRARRHGRRLPPPLTQTPSPSPHAPGTQFNRTQFGLKNGLRFSFDYVFI